MNDVLLLTKKGMKALRKKITKLERERKRLIMQLRDARKDSLGEKGLAIDLESKIGLVDSRLADARLMMRNARLVTKRRAYEAVEIGSVVNVKDSQGSLRKYQLVSSFEADPAKGKISERSPLGRQLLGKKLNDIIDYTFGRTRMTFQLTAIQ